MADVELPSAVTAACPDCREGTIHSVLQGRASTRGGAFTLDATLKCEECGRVHHAVVKEPAPVGVPVVVSMGGQSRRSRVQLSPDEDIEVGDTFVVDDKTCRLTGIESKDGRRVDAASVADAQTLWMVEFEQLAVRFAINLDHKTITKVVPAEPATEFTVGDEHLFGRLRVTVHAIKTKERLVKRGSAEAQEIVRVFAKPTQLGDFTPRPDKRTREQMRSREERR